ncbi:putative bifunctional diguanylate cyclase/phosphodiesterase [Algicella marina]|uniref:EAL domain-containing protein n=1 Tax=Algicella marina TaxID=2683284 RepID=A0A6P1T1U0_9RHOB|nr:EAL domain-containing protein [Algicella marina]QHQ36708.1 EAL domain-containing protein [Algicella marina]
MLKVIGCITQEHDFTQLVIALAVCGLGSVLTVRLFLRARQAESRIRRLHVLLAGLIGGATIWATHFIAMLAYDPALPHGYEPLLTALSLFIALAGTTAALGVAAFSRGGPWLELGGGLFGAAILAIHYTGMAAFQLTGTIQWHNGYLATSVICALTFGALMMNRINHPTTRFCHMASMLIMALAIAGTHFTGMAAMTVVPDLSLPVPPKVVSDATLAGLVLAIYALFLLLGFAAFNIEMQVAKTARARFDHARRYDMTTDLPNRAHLMEYLAALTEEVRQGRVDSVAIVTFDLDGFKTINDLYGHAAGDALLAELSHRLRATQTPCDFVARSGGDEFVLVCAGHASPAIISARVRDLSTLLANPFRHGEAQLEIAASFGIACCPEHGTDLLEVNRHSGLAMFRAKADAYLDTVHFSPQLDADNKDRLALVAALTHALERQEFTLNYQPQTDIRTGETAGFEALLRWRNPTLGHVSPERFIPLAEQSGLIRHIGRWVLREACGEAASWSRPLGIAINVAPQQLVQPDFAEEVSDILIETRLAPERLELEITEVSLIEDQEKATRTMSMLKAMGVHIAMDDFGTGYASLATLQAFPFDKIKIDRSFIAGVHANTQKAAIVRATILLGRSLEIPVLAEGVEAEEELAFLRRENCHCVQGYYYAKPMPADRIEGYLASVTDGRKRAAG